MDIQQRPQRKDGKPVWRHNLRKEKKNITRTKSKDQHHTTLHSGQPWLGWGSPEEEEEGRFHKQEKQKHKKQSELKENAVKG